MSSSTNSMNHNNCSTFGHCNTHQDRSIKEVMETRSRQEEQSRYKTERMKKEWNSGSERRQGVPEEEDLMKEWW